MSGNVSVKIDGGSIIGSAIAIGNENVVTVAQGKNLAGIATELEALLSALPVKKYAAERKRVEGALRQAQAEDENKLQKALACFGDILKGMIIGLSLSGLKQLLGLS